MSMECSVVLTRIYCWKEDNKNLGNIENKALFNTQLCKMDVCIEKSQKYPADMPSWKKSVILKIL